MLKATLLVVDDDKTILKLYSRKLEKLFYKVHPAGSGTEALEILKREAIDLLVTDFKMPDMNGSEIISRASKIVPMLQSIVVTGYSDLKTAIDVMGAGAFNYLPKPVNYDELDFTIQKGLEKRKLLEEVLNKQRQLEEYRLQLEELVEKRTSALTATNQALTREIEERKLLEISLREAKLLAENANKAKSEFLANISHEIRTPMTSAIGLLNLVLDTALLPKQKTYLEMARISTVTMHNLLNDILDFSKIEAGKLSLECIAFNPLSVVESVIDLQHFQAEEKKVRLSHSVGDDVPSLVFGDPNRLRQILLNLVSNALKFTKHGEVVISYRNAEENVHSTSLDERSTFLHFSVQDSGIGIHRDKVDLIFEAFTQADSSTTREYGGVGLGLNISSKLVAMMGGKIWVVSEPGLGSTFHFTCKFGAERGNSGAELGHKVIKQPYITPLRNNKALTVLLIEDDQSNQWVIRELLQKHGNAVIAVSEGLAALQEINNRSFDLILLDLRLPDMTGYEVVARIRQNEKKMEKGKRQYLPIIAMTGFTDENERQKCLEAGMNDFIAKPFSDADLFSKIRQFFHYSPDIKPVHPNITPRIIMNPSALAGEIFNEVEALSKASGNQGLMSERIKTFVKVLPHTLDILRKNIIANERHFLEQEIHRLNERAMEIGATNFADEVFSLLIKLRNNQAIQLNHLDEVENEFEIFRNEKKIQKLLEG
ncbi:MAG: response regulator [Desulforhopalus sp.]